MPISLALTLTHSHPQIMLDAQCTLDASVRHILKYRKLGWKEWKVEITAETVELQVRQNHVEWIILHKREWQSI